MLCKRQTIAIVKDQLLPGALGEEGDRKEIEHGILGGSDTFLYDSVMVGSWYCIYVETDRTVQHKN